MNLIDLNSIKLFFMIYQSSLIIGS